MIDYTMALQFLYPNAEYSLNETYESINWIGPGEKPSDEALQKAYKDFLQSEKDKEYLKKRLAEYPSPADQLLYIHENGFDAWSKMIQGIKDKYPKPN